MRNQRLWTAAVAWLDVSVESAGGGDVFRPIDATRKSDLKLLDRLLTARTPVSKLVGVVDERDVFKFS